MEQNVHEREMCGRNNNKNIPDVVSQNLQAGWVPNQEVSIKRH